MRVHDKGGIYYKEGSLGHELSELSMCSITLDLMVYGLWTMVYGLTSSFSPLNVLTIFLAALVRSRNRMEQWGVSIGEYRVYS